jgi:hypothetical protein
MNNDLYDLYIREYIREFNPMCFSQFYVTIQPQKQAKVESTEDETNQMEDESEINRSPPETIPSPVLFQFFE